MKRYFNLELDFIGISASMICAVHCMAMPLLSSIGLMSVGHHHNHTFDFIFLALGLVIAAFSFLRDFKSHQNKYPLLICIVGFAALYYGITSHHVLFSVIGGMLIATSHFLNYKYNRSCQVQ